MTIHLRDNPSIQDCISFLKKLGKPVQDFWSCAPDDLLFQPGYITSIFSSGGFPVQYGINVDGVDYKVGYDV